MTVSKGVELIAAERERQVTAEDYSPRHDEQHVSGELAMAAACYAAPERIYVKHEYAIGVSYDDPFPWTAPYQYDKRFSYGERRENGGNVPPEPSTYTTEERLDLLVKAGALLAAEIDRILRAQQRGKEK